MTDHREDRQHKVSIAGFAQGFESDTHDENALKSNGLGAVLHQVVSESVREAFASFYSDRHDLVGRIDDIWDLLQQVDRRLLTMPPASRNNSKGSKRDAKDGGIFKSKEFDSGSNTITSGTTCEHAEVRANKTDQVEYPSTEDDSSSDSSSRPGAHGRSSDERMPVSKLGSLRSLDSQGSLRPLKSHGRRPSELSIVSAKMRGNCQESVYNLDAMHTDHLLQSQFFTKMKNPSARTSFSTPFAETPSLGSTLTKASIKSKPVTSKLFGLISKTTLSLSKLDLTMGKSSRKDEVVVHSSPLGVQDNCFNLCANSQENVSDDIEKEEPMIAEEEARDTMNTAEEAEKVVAASQEVEYPLSPSGISRSASRISELSSAVRKIGTHRSSANALVTSSSGRPWKRSSTGTSFGRNSVVGPVAWEASLDALRAEHEAKLVENSFHDLLSEEGDMTQKGTLSSGRYHSQGYGWPMWVLVSCGILPCNESCWGWAFVYLAMSLIMIVLGHSIVLTFHDIDRLYVHVSTAFYASGCLVGLLCLRQMKIENLLGPHNRVLEMYADNFESLDEWQAASFRRLLFCIILGASMVCSRVGIYAVGCPEALGGSGNGDFTSILGYFLVSAGMVSLTYCKLHVCCGLEMFVDKFCFRFFEDKNIGKGIDEWNVLQALLRRSAAMLDSCFLAFGTSVLAVLILIGMGLVHGDRGLQVSEASAHCRVLWCGWLSPPVIMVIYITFKSASVTEKCRRVPALVNSWTFEESLKVDPDRQYVVAYIEHSAAGFYVKGMRLSTIMALKLSYLFGVAVFTLLTQALLRGR